MLIVGSFQGSDTLYSGLAILGRQLRLYKLIIFERITPRLEGHLCVKLLLV